jgi:abhydrolase domain-containing protein 17
MLKRLLKTAMWTLLGCYVFVIVLGQLVSNRMLFFPPPSTYEATGNIQVIDRPGGGKLAIWEEWNPDAAYTILYSHGNGEDLGEIDFVSEMFVEQGFSFVAYDYSGYGLSSGVPTVKNTYADIMTVYTYLTGVKGLEPERIIVMGNSIGSGPGTYLAAKEPVGGLILQSAFTSIYRVVTKNVPIFLGSPYPNLSRIRDINCPLLVIHGTADRVIPFPHGQTLFQHAREPKIFFPMQDVDHNEVLLFADEAYWRAVEDFMGYLQR